MPCCEYLRQLTLKMTCNRELVKKLTKTICFFLGACPKIQKEMIISTLINDITRTKEYYIVFPCFQLDTFGKFFLVNIFNYSLGKPKKHSQSTTFITSQIREGVNKKSIIQGMLNIFYFCLNFPQYFLKILKCIFFPPKKSFKIIHFRPALFQKHT